VGQAFAGITVFALTNEETSLALKPSPVAGSRLRTLKYRLGKHFENIYNCSWNKK
jgi:hypothetical protein